MTTSRWLLPVFGLILLGACTNEKIVYKTREPFNPPPDSVNGFLGYFTVSTKQTTCGNCHVGVQTNWVATKHADAWVDLQASGHASSFCNGCHTVSQQGNNVGHPAGYSVKADTAYQDVQCESCHGPGFTHVQSPTRTNVPLARSRSTRGGRTGVAVATPERMSRSSISGSSRHTGRALGSRSRPATRRARRAMRGRRQLR